MSTATDQRPARARVDTRLRDTMGGKRTEKAMPRSKFGSASLAGGTAAFILFATPHVARADRIDGIWCTTDGLRLSIDGPAIHTPGGNALQGDYSRHFFSYIAPAGETGAGAVVQMRLLNEETMQSRAGEGAPVLTWHRCQPPVS